MVIPVSGVCSYALLPILPVARRPPRLACLIHVASVHPELGSNSTKISVGRNKANDNRIPAFYQDTNKIPAGFFIRSDA